MSDINLDLLRRDECQPLTNEQMTDIKSQFYPSNTANVNIVPYHIYSPNEHVVGEWQEMIDGVLKKKPVYEKTIDCGTLPNATMKTISHGISNIDFICDAKGTFYGPSTNITGSFNWSRGIRENNSFYDVFWIQGDNIKIECSTDRTAYTKSYITLQYTKTTDTWQPV